MTRLISRAETLAQALMLLRGGEGRLVATRATSANPTIPALWVATSASSTKHDTHVKAWSQRRLSSRLRRLTNRSMLADVAVVHLRDELDLGRRESERVSMVELLSTRRRLAGLLVYGDLRIVLGHANVDFKHTALIWRSLWPRDSRAPLKDIALIGGKRDSTEVLAPKVRDLV